MDNNIDQLMTEEEFEVDEIWMQYMQLAEQLLHEDGNRVGRAPRMNSSFTGWKWITEIMEGNEVRCVNMFRMDKRTLFSLCDELESKYGLAETCMMPVLEKVCICLYVLAQGAANRSTSECFQHSGETISRVFHEVIDALVLLSKDLIKPQDPTFANVPPQILGDLRYMPYFKDCIGAIDGTHVPASVGNKELIRYIGRKGVPTQNVMATCSFDMCFTFVVAGWEGSAHDSRIFRDALDDITLGFPKPPTGKYYLVDAGYPQLEGFLGPYKKTIYHLAEFRRGRQPRTPKELFNRWHSSLRSCIERAFGVWKARWKILRVMPSYQFDTQVDIVLATMALHNYIRSKGSQDPIFTAFDQDPEYVPTDDGGQVQVDDADNVDGICSSRSMIALRDDIAQTLWNAHN